LESSSTNEPDERGEGVWVKREKSEVGGVGSPREPGGDAERFSSESTMKALKGMVEAGGAEEEWMEMGSEDASGVEPRKLNASGQSMPNDWDWGWGWA
jgi:hypothetical protein